MRSFVILLVALVAFAAAQDDNIAISAVTVGEAAEARATPAVPPSAACAQSAVNNMILATLITFFGTAALLASVAAIMFYRAKEVGEDSLSPRQKLVLVLLAVLCIGSTVAVGAFLGVSLSQGNDNGLATTRFEFSTGDMLAAHNYYRGVSGRGGLGWDNRLQAMAQEWANYLVSTGQFRHPADLTPIFNRFLGSGGWQRAGENIAKGQTSVQQVTGAWWASPGHKANILGDFTHIGCASNGDIWVCEFGKIRASCFAGDATVVANGAPTRMDRLQPGDRVLDANGQATTFLMWIRKQAQSTLTLRDIHYVAANNSATVRLSPNHHIFVAGGEPRYAKDIVIGDQLITADGLATVVGAEFTTGYGIYAPLTSSGSLMVDGVLCSNYAEFPPTDAALVHAAMSPVRLAHRVLPSSVFESLAHVTNGFHWYPGTLVSAWETILGAKPLTNFVPSSLLSLVSA